MSAVETLDPPASPRRYFTLLNALRGVAAILVVWTHLDVALSVHHRNWPPAQLLENYINGPFEIIQQFGWFAVSLFFLISGFVITDAAMRESARVFALRRLLRIYPPLIFALLVTLALSLVGLGEYHLGHPTALQWLLGATLANYLIAPVTAVVGVAWTLIIEVLFYALDLLLSFVAKRFPLVFPIGILAVVAATLALSRQFGDGFFLFAVSMSYLPILVIGQVVYLMVTRRAQWWAGLPLGLAALLLFVQSLRDIQPAFLIPGNSYGPSVLAAVSLFLVCVVLEGRLKPFRWLDVLSKRSYSIYLMHFPVAYAVMIPLLGVTPALPTTVILLAALAAVAVATEISYRLVERPSQQLGRRIGRAPSSLP